MSHKDFMDEIDKEFTVIIISVILGSLILFFGIAIIGSLADNEDEKTCQDIGGEYKVIDKHWSGKQMINVYGCVK